MAKYPTNKKLRVTKPEAIEIHDDTPVERMNGSGTRVGKPDGPGDLKREKFNHDVPLKKPYGRQV